MRWDVDEGGIEDTFTQFAINDVFDGILSEGNVLRNLKDILDDFFLSFQTLGPFLFDSREKPNEHCGNSSKQTLGYSNLMMILCNLQHFDDDPCECYHVLFLYLSLESNLSQIICDFRDRLGHS